MQMWRRLLELMVGEGGFSRDGEMIIMDICLCERGCVFVSTFKVFLSVYALAAVFCLCEGWMIIIVDEFFLLF